MNERSHSETHADSLQGSAGEDERERIFKVVADRFFGLEESIGDELAVEKRHKLVAKSIVVVEGLDAGDTLVGKISESGVVASSGAVSDDESVVHDTNGCRGTRTRVTRVDIGAVAALKSGIGHVEIEPVVDGSFVTGPWSRLTVDRTRLWCCCGASRL